MIKKIFAAAIVPALIFSCNDAGDKTGTKQEDRVPVNENGEALYRVTELFVTPGGGEIVFQDGNSGELITIDLS